MKRFTLIALLHLPVFAMAQTNFMNNIWMGGSFISWNANCANCSSNYMPYVDHGPNNPVAITDSVPIPLIDVYNEVEFDSGTAVLSDSTGKILVYTNGCKFFDGAHQYIPGSDSLGIGQPNCEGGGDALPGFFLPINDSIVDHIKTHGDYPAQLFRSRLKILPNGTVDFLFYREVFFEFQEYYEYISAVRHGNGRDWWIHNAKVNIEDSTDGYEYMFLLTEAGITDTVEYESNATGRIGKKTFSPDGQWMLRSCAYNEVQLFRVDRCSGLISDLVLLDVPDHYQFFGKDAAFTADSKFIYACHFDSIWRFSVEAPDINASREFAGVHDGDFSEFDVEGFEIQEGDFLALAFRNSFASVVLGRNGKIYLGQGYCGSRYMHLINNPSAPIAEIDFQIRGVTMPTRGWCHEPEIIEYELRDAPGSPCDTLGINGGLGVWSPPLLASSETKKEGVIVSPNPAASTVRFSVVGQNLKTAQIFNAQGALMATQTLQYSSNEVQFEVAAFPDGLYVVQLNTANGDRFSSNFLVVH